MSYPQFIDYDEAVQDPRHSFTDPELQAGRVAETPLGLPLALSGGFALTYTVQSGPRKYAVRCFHREVPEVQKRYSAISTKLRSLASSYFVNFSFEEQGIRIRAKPYPIVKMDWAEGETLGVYLDRAASNKVEIAALRQAFVNLAGFLERNRVAHGDIQNENVIVSKGALRLIDYDGMFVDGLSEGRGTEVGHKHFQHPGRGTKEFGPNMDRFSFIVLDVSLEALQIDLSLHRRFREGGQAIIFKANDFINPSTSEVFRALNGSSALRESAAKLAAICGAPVASVPTLTDFIAGRNIPLPIAQIGERSKPAPVEYIGAYDVVGAMNFDAVVRRVGDKVELVGQVISVKQGIGKRGRGKGRPYVFVNFGVWNQNSVKITIWSEGLGNMSTRPTEAWVGRWISATGLIEPPYEGKHYGRPYRNVGITVSSDSQMIQLTEQEAKFRLGRSSRSGAVPGAVVSKPSNDEILKEIRGGATSRPTTVTTVSRPPPKPISTSSISAKTKNEQILEMLRTPTRPATAGPTSQSAASPSATQGYPPPTQSLLSRIPIWVWVLGVLLIVILLAHG